MTVFSQDPDRMEFMRFPAIIIDTTPSIRESIAEVINDVQAPIETPEITVALALTYGKDSSKEIARIAAMTE